MKLHDLKPAPGSTRERIRKGRGTATGRGKTGGRGQDGQNSRSGGGVRIGFEGGQMPLTRRVPKRGFSNYPFKVEYAVVNVENKRFCFGCIQSKTSVRDRVTRDREPSIHAMQSFFWSVCIALDGDFLKMPKFKAMVNGGSAEFPENGWHGMYVLSDIQPVDRMYNCGFDLNLFTKHALEAAEYWLTQRQWFNREWKAN